MKVLIAGDCGYIGVITCSRFVRLRRIHELLDAGVLDELPRQEGNRSLAASRI